MKEELRRRLAADLGIPSARHALDPEPRGSFAFDGIRVEKWIYSAEPGSRVPAVLYLPPTADGPLPGIALTCGHGESKSQWYISYIAQLYARLGWGCLTLDPIGEEERHRDGGMGTRAHDPAPVIEAAEAAGRPIMGKLVFDTMRGLDFLAGHGGIDPTRLAVAGNSLGGAKAGWLLALETRLKATLVSGWAFGDAMLAWGKLCTTRPNAMLRRRCDWGEFLSLAAPHNAVLVLNGDRDVIIDRDDDGTAWRQTEEALERARRLAKERGEDWAPASHYHPGGGHRPYYAYPPALAWLRRRLGGTAGLPAARIGAAEWCANHGIEIEPLYATQLHCGGAFLPDMGIRALRREELSCLRPGEEGDPAYTLEGWLAAIKR